jgi:hypothetical protein
MGRSSKLALQTSLVQTTILANSFIVLATNFIVLANCFVFWLSLFVVLANSFCIFG